MKMAEQERDPLLIAPCGMDCMVCYRHCACKKPCEGCRSSGKTNQAIAANAKSKTAQLKKDSSIARNALGIPAGSWKIWKNFIPVVTGLA